MPLTDTRAPLTLSFRRSERAAFWTLATGIAAVAAATTAAALDARHAWMWAATAAVLPLPGVFWAPWFELGIRCWNKAARLIAAALRSYALTACYYTVIVAVGRAGTSPEFDSRRADTWWLPRHVPPSRAEGQDHGRRRRGFPADRQEGPGYWALSLAPVTLLLMLLRDDRQESASLSSTYTLY